MVAWFSDVRDRSRPFRFSPSKGPWATSDVWESGYDDGRSCRILTLGTPIGTQGSHGILPKLGFPWRRTKSVGGTYYKFRFGYYLRNMSVQVEGRCWSYLLLGCKLIVCQTPVKSVMTANVHFKQITPKVASHADALRSSSRVPARDELLRMSVWEATPKAALWHCSNSHVLTSEWNKSRNRNSFDLTFTDVTMTVFFSRCIVRFGQDEGRKEFDHVFRKSSSF